MNWATRAVYSLGDGTETEELRIDSQQKPVNLIFSNQSRTALKPTQPPIKWVLGNIFLSIVGQCVKLTTNLHIVQVKNL
jgi:hypothetical protein